MLKEKRGERSEQHKVGTFLKDQGSLYVVGSHRPAAVTGPLLSRPYTCTGVGYLDGDR